MLRTARKLCNPITHKSTQRGRLERHEGAANAKPTSRIIRGYEGMGNRRRCVELRRKGDEGWVLEQSRQALLFSVVVFLHYILCSMYGQTQGRLVLPWYYKYKYL